MVYVTVICEICDDGVSNGSSHQHYRFVMWRHVSWYVYPSVSDKPAASIFRIYLHRWQSYQVSLKWYTLVIHSSEVCLTCPQPLPKRVLYQVRSSASFFLSFQYPLVSLRTSSSCLHLIPRLPVASVLTSIFPSITCFRRQFLRNMWPIQLAFLHFCCM